MRKLLYILSFIFLATSCDDGDVIEVELAFEDTLTFCDEITQSYLLYKIKSTPYESMSLLFPNNNSTDLIFNPSENNYQETLTIDGSNVKFNYRTYNGNPQNLLCALIPGSGVNIINDYPAASGATVEFLSTFIDDDNDGIPSADEDENLDGDNNYLTNPSDFDGDGIFNYIDADDDNDNVLTKNEDDNEDGDNNPFTNPKDTDNDGLPNYLDADDDGDGIDSRLEDENGNGILTDDFDEEFGIQNTARYLDNTASFEYEDTTLNVNDYVRTVTVSVEIQDVDLGIFSRDLLSLGTYTKTINLTD
ncbi:hypothetical protein [Ichthyenterobacterium magnum]|uniref:Thrombospondin type 3 repeat-containing protein n=1 Tax=Ichthyenterobacterium magnum TaxID=1230530 RepID=A0A420DKJ9_9FLAO|nr:hypothetical protein [Ichthyenterobacterium magnum]RKE94739.1 hypothetical protein BXY80_1751 [Ichthyenterobacterium magnum]